MATTTRPDHRVNVPEGKSGNVEVRRFEVVDGFQNWRLAMEGRACRPGTYTALHRNGALWMSDTTAEWQDNLPAVWQMEKLGGRVLINGLGLGMIVRAALAMPHVEHVDVVELDPDVITLVGPTYASDRCTIHHADAYTIQWPVGTRWTAAWHDIWRDLCEDNLPLMTRLHRKYGRRVDWQASWGRGLLESQRRRNRHAWWNR